MLERTAGCLGESGTLRRLLPVSKKSTKTHRSLQSGFWIHGALNLELAPLWTALVRASEPVEYTAIAQLQRTSRTQHTMLDFLYPAGTLNIMRNYSKWWTERQDGRFARNRFRKPGQRLYTSSATGTPNSSGRATGLDIEGVAPTIDRIELLYSKLRLTESYDFEEAWRKFMQQEATDQHSLRQALMKYLCDSERNIDAERTMTLFEMLDSDQKNSEAYRWAIRACLKLRNLSDAIALHTAATDSLRLPSGSEELMAYFIKNSFWSRALSLHKGFLEYRRKHRDQRSLHKFDICSELGQTPNLPTLAQGLASFAKQRSEEFSSAQRAADRDLTFQVLRKALTMPDRFDATSFDTLFSSVQEWSDTSDLRSLYHDAFSMLVRLNEMKLLVRCYRRAHNHKDVKFYRRTLILVLDIFCSNHSVLGMKEVLDDFFRIYGTPSQLAYILCMREFASQGDAETVHALFQQLITSRDKAGNIVVLTADHFSPLLQVHAKRGEFAEVVDQFHRIGSEHGLKPSLLCYNILLNAYGKVHKFDKALETYEKILADPSFIPDEYTFATMLGICSIRGDIDLAYDVYSVAESLKVTTTTAMTDAIVHLHCQNGQLDQAEKHCEVVFRRNLKGSKTRMWNYLIVAHAMQHDIPNVNRILQRMTEAGIDYDGYTYSALMQALCMVRQPSRAYAILQDVMPEAGIRASNFHYAVVMGGFLATGELDKLFHVHNRLTKRSLEQSAGTNLLLIKGIAKEEEASHYAQPERQQTEGGFKQALKLFHNIIASADASEISDGPRKGATGVPLDVAYSTMLYRYVLLILGQSGQFETVNELYSAFLATLPTSSQRNPPISFLSALMDAKLREGDHEAVHQQWELALSEANKTGSPLPSVSIDPAQLALGIKPNEPSSVKLVYQESKLLKTGEKILHAHRLNLDRHVNIYMESLFLQNKRVVLANLVTVVYANGFEMSSRSWNRYVQFQARLSNFRVAFRVCEDRLMSGFTGWARIRRDRLERNRLPMDLRRLRKNPRFMRPEYLTLLWLARGYMRAEVDSGESRGADDMIDWMARECPTTVQALQTMQRTGEPLEREILSL